MPDYSLAELAALTGLPTRTIRYYMAQGLIPSPGREGRATRYPESTLARLRLITSLRDAHQPLAEIRRRLEELSDDEVVALSGAPPAPPAHGSALEFVRRLLGDESPAGTPTEGAPVQIAIDDLSPPAPSTVHRVEVVASPMLLMEAGLSRHGKPAPALGDRSQWERIVIAPDIELHVRRPLSKPANRTVERLLAFARQLQGEQER